MANAILIVMRHPIMCLISTPDHVYHAIQLVKLAMEFLDLIVLLAQVHW